MFFFYSFRKRKILLSTCARGSSLKGRARVNVIDNGAAYPLPMRSCDFALTPDVYFPLSSNKH